MKSKVIVKSRESAEKVVNQFHKLFYEKEDRIMRSNSYIMINDIPYSFNENNELVEFKKV